MKPLISWVYFCGIGAVSCGPAAGPIETVIFLEPVLSRNSDFHSKTPTVRYAVYD
jgi:hypothetical protein